MPKVELVNITKRYKDLVAIDHLSLRVEDGEYLTIVGPTNAGKTTTLMIIAGLVKPDEGEIYIDGKLVNDVLPEERGVGFVFQSFELFPHMNVWDNVTYGPFVKGWDPDVSSKTAREMLEMVRLAGRSDAAPAELSGGMQQRIALARALTSGARLLLLDEPLGSLDAKIRTELRYELRRLVKDLGLTAIHVTHDTEEAVMISDKIAVLRKGKILQVGTPDDVYFHPADLFVANFIGESSFLEGTIAKVDGRGATIKVENGENVWITDKTRRIGERVVVAVKAENIIVEKGKVEKQNALFGRIERSKFISGYTRYEIRLDNGVLVVTRQPASAKRRLEVNSRVTISFEPEKALVYPYPEEGLEKALASE